MAVPVVISNVSTPLIGVVDTAVVGQIPDPAYIGAAAIGGLIFSFVFWGFGFLRIGTTGLTAQALGSRDYGRLSMCTISRARHPLCATTRSSCGRYRFRGVTPTVRYQPASADRERAINRGQSIWLQSSIRSDQMLHNLAC
jgi:hypothetical protein